MAESLETRFRRLLLMVPYVLSRPGVAVAEVCRRFGISRSQLSSDISLLFVCGLPGYGPGDLIEAQIIGDQVWIRLADYFSRPLRLTPAEGLLLYAGARAMLSSGVADEALGRALERLEQALSPDTLSRVAVELEGAGDLATVREALALERRVHLVYYAHSRDEITERDVDPWALFVSGGRWYLVGWCHRVGDERIFRVDRIRSVALLEAAADIPADLDLSRYESLYVEGADATHVVLDLAGEVAGWVAAAYPLQSQEPLAEGWTRVRLSAGGTAWLEKLLLRLGHQARVVEPHELSERVRERASRLAARYA